MCGHHFAYHCFIAKENRYSSNQKTMASNSIYGSDWYFWVQLILFYCLGYDFFDKWVLDCCNHTCTDYIGGCVFSWREGQQTLGYWTCFILVGCYCCYFQRFHTTFIAAGIQYRRSFIFMCFDLLGNPWTPGENSNAGCFPDCDDGVNDDAGRFIPWAYFFI